MQLFEQLGLEVELARSALAYADHLNPAGAIASHVAERAQQLRRRARELLDRHKGITIRANLGPAKV
ncbi:MAG TPA: hypothetical protein VF331_01515 [Polyangiales bacterium]